MAADVAVSTRSSRPGRGKGSLGNFDIKLVNKKMTLQHTVRSKKLDERQLFKLIQNLDGQQNRRLLNIDKQVTEISKDLEKLVSDQDASKQQRIARRATLGDEIDKLDAEVNRTVMRHRRRSTQFDAFAFRLKRESEAIRSPAKASRALFRFDSRGNQMPDLSPVQSTRSREMDCSPNDIAMMALRDMKDFAANQNTPDPSERPFEDDISRAPSRAATSAMESVSIRSALSSDDEKDCDVTKTSSRRMTVVKSQTNTQPGAGGGNDWSTILNAVVDGKLLAALRKELANPTAAPATAPAAKEQVRKPKNAFIQSKWARLASVARENSRQEKEQASKLNNIPQSAPAGAAAAPAKNLFLKRVLQLPKSAPEPPVVPVPSPIKFPLRRRYVDRGAIASTILLGMSSDANEDVSKKTPPTPYAEPLRKEVSFADDEPQQQSADDGSSSSEEDDTDDVDSQACDDGPLKSSCDVPDCICHCKDYRRSAPARMDRSRDDYYSVISRSYAASTGQAIVSPVFQSLQSPHDWTVGRRSALPPPSPTPSEILEGVDCKTKTDNAAVDYTELDAISSVRRPMKGSNREMLLKEKEANARITFQLMRQKMNEKHPHDFNRNYGTPTPNWKILNPLKLRHKINQSSPLYTNWGI